MAGIVHRQKQGDQLLLLPSENIFFQKLHVLSPILDQRKGIIIQYYGSMFSLMEWDITVSTDEDLQDKSSFLKRQDTGQCVEYMLKIYAPKLCLVHKRPAIMETCPDNTEREGDLLSTKYSFTSSEACIMGIQKYIYIIF